MIEQAVILAGGLGTRLGEITKNTPKPMVLINKKPFLEFLVCNLKRNGVKQIIFSTGYLAEQISTYFGDGSSYGLDFVYIEESEPLGTGGALKFSSSLLDKIFLVLNGDSFFDFELIELDKILLTSENSLVAMALKFEKNTRRYGRVVLDGQYVKGYLEKGVDSNSGLINAGVYLIKKEALDFLPQGFCSLEYDLFPRIVEGQMIIGMEFSGYFIDIGLPVDLKKAQTELISWSENNNLFNYKR
jgi:NDP-sugar pyrophosphorylase family protein